MPIEIPLTHGKVALIDAEDLETVKDYVWKASRHQNMETGQVRWYAYTIIKRRHHRMHRIILKTNPLDEVDHKNHDGLDNRRENLRLITKRQNQQNARKRGGEAHSQYKGVSYFRPSYSRTNNPWIAYIIVDGKKKHLGCFATEASAAKAYNDAALLWFGDYASLNDIPTEILSGGLFGAVITASD